MNLPVPPAILATVIEAYGSLPGEKYIKELGFYVILIVFAVGTISMLVSKMRGDDDEDDY